MTLDLRRHPTVYHTSRAPLHPSTPCYFSSLLFVSVVSLHWAPCGTCPACVNGHPTHCVNTNKTFFGLTVNGGYAEYCVNASAGWMRVPNADRGQWTAVQAASVMCTYGTVWHAAFSRGR